MITENRVYIYISNYGVYIDSPPYKSLKYALHFILYLIAVALFILGVIYWDKIFFNEKFPLIIEFFSLLFFIGFMGYFAAGGLPLFFSIIKNSFYRNYFLKEHLSIEKEKIEYSNSFGIRISYKLSNIKWIYFEFNKTYNHIYIHKLMPNYTPTIYLRDHNYNIVAKTMYSIKEEEIQNVYKIILDYLLTEKHFYKERDVNYTDKIKNIQHRGKEIEFISVHQFFKLHNDKFSIEERSYYYKLAEQQAASEDELANALLSKIKDNHSNEM